MTTTWTKTYTDPQLCRTAAENHQWLARQIDGLNAPLELPRLRRQAHRELTFDYVRGRHARPHDLITIAGIMGHLHRTMHHAVLHRARLGEAFRADSTLSIPDFITPRQDRILTLLGKDQVPSPALTTSQALQVLKSATNAPAAIYTDANLRNVLVADSKIVMVDYDCLTLAPFGYDLAKLIVSLAMTHGPLPPSSIAEALTAYNRALTASSPALPTVTWQNLMQWTEIHHILTSPYRGSHGYHHSWHQTRPTRTPPSS